MRIHHLIVFRRMHFANMVICDRMADSAWLARLGRSRPNAASENQNNYVRNIMRCRYYLVAFSPFRHRAWIEGERERESQWMLLGVSSEGFRGLLGAVLKPLSWLLGLPGGLLGPPGDLKVCRPPEGFKYASHSWLGFGTQYRFQSCERRGLLDLSTRSSRTSLSCEW